MNRTDHVVFRLPFVALILPFVIFVCVAPLATAPLSNGAHPFFALYLLPVLALLYVTFTRTIAGPDDIRTRSPLGIKRLAWADLNGLEFRGPRWAIAVGLDGTRFRLPMVRPRDLPRLAAVSGGRLLLGKDAPEEIDPKHEEAEIDGTEIEGAEIERGTTLRDQQMLESAEVISAADGRTPIGKTRPPEIET